MNNKNKKIIFISILGIVFFSMYILNSKTLLVSDDYPYQFIFTGRYPNSNTLRVTNPLQIFESMKNHWLLWGGRVTIHYFLQLAFMLGIPFFNIFNSFMFTILGFLIYKHINNNKNIKISLLIFVYTMLFLFIPQPGSTIMWKSGSANYLWSSVFILCMTLIYKKHYNDNTSIKNNNRNFIVLFLLGLLTGCCNENSGCALIMTELLFTIIYKHKYKNIPKWAISGLIGTLISYIFLVISPGNYIRANIMYPNVEYSITNIFEYILKITRLTYSYLTIPIIFTIITIILIYNKKEKIDKFKEKYLVQIIFIIFSIISIYSLVLSPAYPERSWTFAFIYLIIVIGLNINYIDLKKEYIGKFYTIIVSILLTVTISEYSTAYYNINFSYEELNEQLIYIKKQEKAGIKDVIVSEIVGHEGKYNAFVDNGYFGSKEDGWLNTWVAKYYHLNSIKTNN